MRKWFSFEGAIAALEGDEFGRSWDAVDADILSAGLIKLEFSVSSSMDAGVSVKKIATIDKLRKKLILMQPYDKALYLSGLREKGVPGYIYIFAHSSAVSIQGISVKNIDVLVNLINQSDIRKNNEPIMIDACFSGAIPEGIASQLAVKLKTYVTAPTTQTWNYPLGGSAIGQGAFKESTATIPKLLAIPSFISPGRWNTWGPDGKLVESKMASPRDLVQ